LLSEVAYKDPRLYGHQNAFPSGVLISEVRCTNISQESYDKVLVTSI
jgi:hypothetical protein